MQQFKLIFAQPDGNVTITPTSRKTLIDAITWYNKEKSDGILEFDTRLAFAAWYSPEEIKAMSEKMSEALEYRDFNVEAIAKKFAPEGIL